MTKSQLNVCWRVFWKKGTKKEFEERRLAREFELERLRAQLRNTLNGNKLKAGNRINDLANVCILSENRTTEVSEPVNKCRPLINPVVNKSVENATSCDFEKKNCDPPVRCTNVSHPSEVGGKEFNVNRSSDCDVKMKVGVCEGRVKTVAMGAQRVRIPDTIEDGSFELKRDKGVTNPEGLICENSCEEKYTLGTLMGCEKQLKVDRESFRNHTIAKIAGQSNRTLPVVWLGRVNRYPYPRIKCMKYRNLHQGEGVVTSSIVVNPHLSISVMVSPAGQGHVRRHQLSLHFYDPPAVE
ncbi:uncharacterized protein TNCV_391001 [Trichonephila clavipes]|nr:uncharacterized protein TNCV_391001 [Trichonephila clavipes]